MESMHYIFNRIQHGKYYNITLGDILFYFSCACTANCLNVMSL